jgi:starch phosphorylase
VGLLYSHGYFAQRLNPSGWQFEEDVEVELPKLPLELALGVNGQPVHVKLETRTNTIYARVFKLYVGRILLLLLDSNVQGNQPEDRQLTAHLYGGTAARASARSCSWASAGRGRYRP